MKKKILIFIIYLFIFNFSLNAQQSRSDEEITNIIRVARNDFINYNYQSGLILLNSVIEEGIQNPFIRMQAYMNRGNIYLNLKQYHEALNDFNIAVMLNYNIPLLFNLRADTYILLERYQEALLDINKAIELNPNELMFYIDRARIYIFLGQYQNAINETDYILRRDPNHARAYLIRASAYSHADFRNEEEMLNNINFAISIDPNDPEYYEFRGRIYGTRGRYQDALDDFNKAIILQPNYAEYYRSRSIVYRNLAEQSENDEQRKEYLELRRRDIETYRRLSDS